MALLAALPHPTQLVRSTTSYLLAPAPVDDGVAFLTVPRRLGGPAWMARVSGDRLVVQRTTGARTLVDSGCEVAAECNAVRAPVGDGLDVVYGVPNDGGGGYVARAGVNGRSQIVFADESASGAVLAYTAANGSTVYLAKGAIVMRTAVAAPVTLIRAAAATARRRARRRGLGHGRRAGSRAPARAGLARRRQGRHRRRDRRVTDARPGVRLGTPALTDDGTVAFARRVPVGAGSARFEVVAIPPGTNGRILAASPAVPIRDADLLPRIAIHGTTVVYRLRDGAGGRLGGDPRHRSRHRVTTRRSPGSGGARAACPTPPSDATRIVWSQTDFRAGRFVRSRILRVRVGAVGSPHERSPHDPHGAARVRQVRPRRPHRDGRSR